MNIIICGLTAAGKTTHCKLITQEFAQLGFNYVSASTLLLANKEKTSSDQEKKPLDYWISDEALELNNWRRENRKFDTDLDLQCKKTIESGKESWVVDVLSASWLSENSGTVFYEVLEMLLRLLLKSQSLSSETNWRLWRRLRVQLQS